MRRGWGGSSCATDKGAQASPKLWELHVVQRVWMSCLPMRFRKGNAVRIHCCCCTWRLGSGFVHKEIIHRGGVPHHGWGAERRLMPYGSLMS